MGEWRTMTLQIMVMLLIMVVRVSSEATVKSCETTVESQTFGKCRYFSLLESTLWWTYDTDKNSMDFAFRTKPASKGGWVGWGINPNTTGMVGTQAVIAFQHSNGSMVAMTYNVVKPPNEQEPSALSFPVSIINSTINDGTITIFASLVLPSKKTAVSHTWQVGGEVKGVVPQSHPLAPANLNSFGPLDLLSGVTAPAGPVGAMPPTTKTTPPSTPASSSNSAIHLSLPVLAFSSSLFLCFLLHLR
ncbi:hypothetical protein SUGI_0738530 [Cryptomeria japonica]|uniref:cytochrome b561 and DOMON domain-containing protein At5g35735 n=1 Tax=Cryptomeria japonica TaxID=3369 RepID=UPI002414C035|nr:cytochrome b561 and DOMON domain-containing protein At5g35735 [Cryptomeria japonica]GLJ36700.1 hypothetical protein SUGI_0738530 [Cryptomeria japonica]